IEIDRRATNEINSSTLQTFQDAQRARATAELVVRRFLQYDPKNPQLAEVQSLAGFMYIMFAEDYCNGVPTSSVDDAGAFNYGAGQTGQQLLQIALAKFDSAKVVAAAAKDNNSLNLARIGRARTLVDLNRLPEAAAEAAAVPSSFNYSIQHSENSGRENNAIYAFNYLENRFSVADSEGHNGINFVTAADPRLPTFDAGAGFNGGTELFLTSKYGKRTSPTPLAIGSEARLIQAEAALRAGDLATFLDMLNQARAAAPTYPAAGTNSDQLLPSPAPLTLADIPATTAGQQDLLFRERAFTLYLTSHRVGDLRRLIWQYGRNSETVFPTGDYQDGSQYGTAVNLPIPKEESNNQNVTYSAHPGCINRSAGII
ncbi:MAG: RagB/SusD protein, partial [Gemmatimonadetes bacterium]|nr:RagB/SusD protein [Gemmatimonadota bacterium]